MPFLSRVYIFAARDEAMRHTMGSCTALLCLGGSEQPRLETLVMLLFTHYAQFEAAWSLKMSRLVPTRRLQASKTFSLKLCRGCNSTPVRSDWLAGR